jgi:Zn-dependent protease with chaperone function
VKIFINPLLLGCFLLFLPPTFGVPLTQEAALSNYLEAQTNRHLLTEDYVHGLSTDRYLLRYLNRMVARLQTQTSIQGKLKVQIIEADFVDAHVTGGNTVLINRGLLYFVKSRSELAGVLAHELAHLENKDVDHRQTIAENLSTDKGEGWLISSHHDRENEFRADHAGMKIMEGAGFNPQGMANFLARLQSDLGEAPHSLKDFEEALKTLSESHPPTAERAERAQHLILTKGWDSTRRDPSLKVINNRETHIFESKKLGFSEALKIFDSRYTLPIEGKSWETFTPQELGLLTDNPRELVSPASEILTLIARKSQTEADLIQLSQRYRSLSVFDATILASHFARIMVKDFEGKTRQEYNKALLPALKSFAWDFRPDLFMETSAEPSSILQKRTEISFEKLRTWQEKSVATLLEVGLLSTLLDNLSLEPLKQSLASKFDQKLRMLYDVQDFGKSYIIFDYLADFSDAKRVPFFEAASQVIPNDGYSSLDFLGMLFTAIQQAEQSKFSPTLNRLADHLPGLDGLISFLSEETPELRVHLLRTFLAMGELGHEVMESGSKSIWPSQIELWYDSLLGHDYSEVVRKLSKQIPITETFSDLDRDFLLLFRIGLLLPSRKGLLSAIELEAVLPELSEQTRLQAKALQNALIKGSSTEGPMFRLLLLHGDRLISRGHFRTVVTQWLDTPQKLLRMKNLIRRFPPDAKNRQIMDEVLEEVTEKDRGLNPKEFIKKAHESFGEGIEAVIKRLDTMPRQFQFKNGESGSLSVMKTALKEVHTPDDAQKLARYLNASLRRAGNNLGSLNFDSDQLLFLKKAVFRIIEIETQSMNLENSLEFIESLKSRLPFSEFEGNFDDRILAHEMARQFQEKASGLSQMDQVYEAVSRLTLYKDARNLEFLGAAKYRKALELNPLEPGSKEELDLLRRFLPVKSDARDTVLSEFMQKLSPQLSEVKALAFNLISSDSTATRLGLSEFMKFEKSIHESSRSALGLGLAIEELLPRASAERDYLIDRVLRDYARTESEIRKLERLKRGHDSNPQLSLDFLESTSTFLKPKLLESWLQKMTIQEIIVLILELVEANPEFLTSDRSTIRNSEKQMIETFLALPEGSQEEALSSILRYFEQNFEGLDRTFIQSWFEIEDLEFKFTRRTTIDAMLDLTVGTWFKATSVEESFLSWFMARDLQNMSSSRRASLIAAILLAQKPNMGAEQYFKLYMAKREYFGSRSNNVLNAFEWKDKADRPLHSDLSITKDLEIKRSAILDILAEENPDLEIQELGRRVFHSSTILVFEAVVNGESSIVTVAHPETTQRIAQDIHIYEKMLLELEAKPLLKKRFGLKDPRMGFNRMIIELLDDLDLETRTKVLSLLKQPKPTLADKAESTHVKSFNIQVHSSASLVSGARRFGHSRQDLARLVTEKFLDKFFRSGSFPAGLKESNLLVTEEGRIYFSGKDLTTLQILKQNHRLLFRLLLQVKLTNFQPSKQNYRNISQTLAKIGGAKTGGSLSSASIKNIFDVEDVLISEKLLLLFHKAGISGNLIAFADSLRVIENVAKKLDSKFSLTESLNRRLVSHFMQKPLHHADMEWKAIIGFRSNQNLSSEHIARTSKAVLEYINRGDRRSVLSIIHAASQEQGPMVIKRMSKSQEPSNQKHVNNSGPRRSKSKFKFYSSRIEASINHFQPSGPGEKLKESIRKLSQLLKFTDNRQNEFLAKLSPKLSSSQPILADIRKLIMEAPLNSSLRRRIITTLDEISNDPKISKTNASEIIDTIMAKEVYHRIQYRAGEFLQPRNASFLANVGAKKAVRIVTILGEKASSKIAHSMHTVFTVAAMHMLTEYYYTGETNPKKAVLSLLDAPEFWISMQASQIGALIVPKKFTRLSSISPGMEKFAGVLQPMVQNLAVLVTWDIATAYATRAMQGLTKEGKLLTMTEIFDDSRLLKRYIRNLFSVVADPKAASEIFPHLFKYRWLSAEFGTMLVGMTAGSRIGASLGSSAVVAGPQAGVIGRGLGGFIGAVGGAVGASIPGRKLDIWLMRRGIKEKREELKASLLEPSTGDFKNDYKRAGEGLEIIYDYESYREQLVGLLSSFYLRDLAIQAEKEAEQTQAEKDEAKKELDQQKNEILAIFKADQRMFQSILDRKETKKPLRELIITLENQVVLAAGVIEAQFLQTEPPTETKAPIEQPADSIGFEDLAR